MRRGWAAALLAAALVAAPAAAHADDLEISVTVPEASTPSTAIESAELRWGLNVEAGSAAFAGGCNFLSAGTAGDAGGARAWTEQDGFFQAEDGDVTVVRPTTGGEWEPTAWGTKCLDPAGNPVTTSSTASASGAQVVLSEGRGSFGPDGADLRWRGSFTVAFYGGMTYWSATDPQLTLDSSGDGVLTATLSGYGTSMDDMTKWEPLPERSVVLAEVRDADLSTGGFSVVPEYLGVSTDGQVERTDANAAHWGSFPASFVSYQRLTGQAAYWFTSGGQRDAAKPATELIVNTDSAAPSVAPAAPAPAPTGQDAVPRNEVQFGERDLAEVPASAPAQATAQTATVLGAAQAASTVSRSGPGLVPEASGDFLATTLLPLAGALLAMLLSVLAILQLSGRLVFPWSKRS